MTSERGFSMVEALVAFAILAVTLVALYEAMGTGVRGLSRSNKVDVAVLIAQSKLAELATLRIAPQTPLEGTIAGAGYRWRVEMVAEKGPPPPELAASPLRPQKIKLSIFWAENGRARAITIERLLLFEQQPGA